MSARRAILPVFVPHLGCPHACVFCDQRRISGRQAPATAETVSAVLKKAAGIPAPNGRELAFYGGSFTAIPTAEQEALLAPALRAKQAGFLQGIRLSTRPDCIDEGVLDRLSAYGVTTVELGAQSMDDGVLALSGRGHSAADTRRASGLVKVRGFELILQMMTGLPGDSPEKAERTARVLAALRPTGVRIYPTVVLRDTPLHALWRAGKYRAQSVEEAVELCASLLDIFEGAGIPVIRLGLNPTEALSAGGAVAGAYHPALGEKCLSRQMRNRLEPLLADCRGKKLLLMVPRGKASVVVGQRRENINYFMEKYAPAGIRVREGDLTEVQTEIE